MASADVDVAVVGSGFCGLFVARELLRAGREVTIVERGATKSHARQLADHQHALDIPSAAPNHERRQPPLGAGGRTPIRRIRSPPSTASSVR